MLPSKTISTIQNIQDSILHIIEIVLALLVICATVYFSFNNLQGLMFKDWSSTYVMYEFISVILLILLGLELARLILIHSINVVMELMLLVIARKMLYPEISPLELLFCVIAFCLIVGVYYFNKLKPIKSLEDLSK